MKAKEVAMTIALAVLGALFVGLFVDAVYEAPQYEDFCGKGHYNEAYPMKPVPAGHTCNYVPSPEERTAIDACYQDEGQPEFTFDEYGCQSTYKECNYCSKYFNEANNKYNRNIFFMIAPIGVIAVISGLFLSFEVVGTGLMFSGILLVAYATMQYFSDMSKMLRVIVIFIEFVLLILISIKKLKK